MKIIKNNLNKWLFLLFLLTSFILVSNNPKEQLISHIGECFKVGKKGFVIIEAVLPKNSETSHDVGVLYYTPEFHPIFQRDTATYSFLKSTRETTNCTDAGKNFKKYDWDNYKLTIKTI